MLRALRLLGHNLNVSQRASVIAIFFLSSGAEDTNGHFIDIIGYENTKHNIQKTWQHSIEYGVFTTMIVA